MSRALWLPSCPACPALGLLLLVLWELLGASVLSICPAVCHCSRGHRVVDCSSRGLTKLPPGLQHNIRFLNISFNSLQALDSQLSHYAHLRTLDLSFNRLESLPPALPRSLWDIRATGNHLKSLDKNDTAYHWNLKILDLSDNELERIVFINNTLPSLQALNLSYNRFWTVPTNMPHHLESIDLSHNFLVQILPGSLDRLPRLTRIYLHSNRFLWLNEGIFEKLSTLEVMTLGDNPWACEEEDNMTNLLKWIERTRATVFGCPCHIKPICGRSHLGTSNGEWHSALFTETPFWVESRVSDRLETQQRTALVTTGSRTKSAMFESGIFQDNINESVEVVEWASTSSSTQTSTTARPKTTTKKILNSQNGGNRLEIHSVTVLLSLTTVYRLNG